MKNIFKKISVCFIALVMVVGLTSCSDGYIKSKGYSTEDKDLLGMGKVVDDAWEYKMDDTVSSMTISYEMIDKNNKWIPKEVVTTKEKEGSFSFRLGDKNELEVAVHDGVIKGNGTEAISYAEIQRSSVFPELKGYKYIGGAFKNDKPYKIKKGEKIILFTYAFSNNGNTALRDLDDIDYNNPKELRNYEGDIVTAVTVVFE